MCIGFLSAADGCPATTSMCCIYAWSSDALHQVQRSATETELSWRSQYVRSSDVAASIGVADVAASLAADVSTAEDACHEPAANACQSWLPLMSCISLRRV